LLAISLVRLKHFGVWRLVELPWHASNGAQGHGKDGEIDEKVLGDNLELETARGIPSGIIETKEDVVGKQGDVGKMKVGEGARPAMGDLHKNCVEDETKEQGKPSLQEIHVCGEQKLSWRESDAQVTNAGECEAL
jgi:hypothetical protein